MKLVTIKNKVIHEYNVEAFEREMDSFLADKDSYSIQYKPCATGTDVIHCALITYHEVPEDEE